MNQTDRNKAVVRRWFDAFPDLWAVFDELVHPAVVNHPAPPPLREGRDSFRRVMAAVLAAAPDQTYRVDHALAEGDRVVARTRWAGTFQGAFLGVRGNGRRFEVGQFHEFRLEGGRLVEHWAVRDDLEVFRQTGVAPPAGHV